MWVGWVRRGEPGDKYWQTLCYGTDYAYVWAILRNFAGRIEDQDGGMVVLEEDVMPVGKRS